MGPLYAANPWDVIQPSEATYCFQTSSRSWSWARRASARATVWVPVWEKYEVEASMAAEMGLRPERRG